MTILFYTPTADETGRRLQTALEAVVPEEKILNVKEVKTPTHRGYWLLICDR